jgi:hypothetical protein
MCVVYDDVLLGRFVRVFVSSSSYQIIYIYARRPIIAVRFFCYVPQNFTQGGVNVTFYNVRQRYTRETPRAPPRKKVLYDKGFVDSWNSRCDWRHIFCHLVCAARYFTYKDADRF